MHANSGSPRRWDNLRVLAGFARPHLSALVLGLFLALGGSAATLATPMVTKWVLDTLGTDASLRGPTLVLVALLAVGAVFGCAQWIVLGTVAEKVVYDARTSLVGRFFAATVPGVQQRSVGELVTRVTSDTILLREAASSAAVNIVNAATLTLGTIVLMGVLDLPLLGVTLAAIAVTAALFGVLMPRIAAAEARTQESLGGLGSKLEGGLRALRTVKVSRAENRIGAQITADASDARRHAVTAVRVSAIAWTVAWTGVQGSVIAILAFGAWRVADDEMAVSTLIAFLLYAITLMGPVGELAQNVTALQSGIAAATRIRQLEDVPVEHDAVGAVSDLAEPDSSVIEMQNVTLRYPGASVAAVAGLTLTIPARGHTAIVGPSGAGKTTVLSMILRFVEPEDGQVLLGGIPYPRLTHGAVRSQVAYVEQETPLLPGTIRENIVFSNPDASETEIWDALRLLHLSQAFEALPAGLDTPLTEASLSGGQRQRIAMARAILRPARVLLLDEATAQVDTITEAAIVDTITERARTGAVVTVAHRLSTVRNADRIVLMEEGRIRCIGTHDQLLVTDELYREMVHVGRLERAVR
ncbi:ABC transporter ATP-binding protein [Rhodococcus sp. ABRD24]|uniref:ABC transporter ATP-binding protein n=1 Tax=Rhodococcus sp. ABRD24 TaxID=2507582 RepID=UPI00103C2ED4|nr:ABC transporter ATP-binding protein [Rhodococcus sp. ABRD24]QBJ98014.1 ABC transporter ATP-binding protein [Rhodococcus sp. ABRD24]